jgi:proton glutamate symport protein
LGIAFIGLFVGFVSIPLIGDDADMRKTIGQLMIDKKIDTRYQEVQSKEKAGLADFLINIIPQNIFTALSKNQTPKIIFFFIVLGVMIKFVSEKAGNSIIMLSEGIFEAFQALIKFVMYFLPLGLCALLSDQVSQIGFAVLGSLVKLIVIIYVSALLVFILSTLIIWRYSGGSYFRQYIALKDAIVIAMGTRSSFPTLPSAISGLCDGLNLNKERTHLTVPLGFSLCKYGKILIFCIGAVFAAHLYNYSLGIEGILIIVISSILAGMAASGAPSIISRSMISMVLLPLGIPPEAIIVILLTIDPIVDPIITLINTYPNYAATAMIAGRKAEI